MSIARSAADWRTFVSGCLDFRPDDNVYRVARQMFTEPELFDHGRAASEICVITREDGRSQ